MIKKTINLLILMFACMFIYAQCDSTSVAPGANIDTVANTTDLSAGITLIIGDSRGEGLGDALTNGYENNIVIFKHEDNTLENYKYGTKYLLATSGPSDFYGLEVPLSKLISDNNYNKSNYVYKLVRSGRAACEDVINAPDDWNTNITSPTDLYNIFQQTYPLFIDKVNNIFSCVTINSVVIFLGANDANNINCSNDHYNNMVDLINGIISMTGVSASKIFIPEIGGDGGNKIIIKQAHNDLSNNLGINVVPTDASYFLDGVHENNLGLDSVAQFIYNSLY